MTRPTADDVAAGLADDARTERAELLAAVHRTAADVSALLAGLVELVTRYLDAHPPADRKDPAR